MSSSSPLEDTRARAFVAEPFLGERRVFEAAPGSLLPASLRRVAGNPVPGSAAGGQLPAGAGRTVEQAFEEGVAEGRGELPVAEAEALSQAADALAQAVAQLGQWRRNEQRRLRHVALQVARLVAERVICCELHQDLDLLTPRVEAALGLLGGAEPLRVTLAPADQEVLAANGAPRLERLLTEWGAVLEADPTLAPGDVLVRGGETLVDGRLTSVLDRVGEALAELVGVDEEPPQ